MTIFYLDPENGNDANDGLSFANRWKTLGNGATAARIAPGDTIRFIQSPDPESVGTITWTDGSAILTPAVSKNLLVDDFNVAWTGVPNVTVTKSTNSASLKAGPAYLNASYASAFTTGKTGYITLGAPLDLSSYNQLSLWVMWTFSTVSVNIRLCSDATGDVPLATLTIPGANYASNQWGAVVLDNGGPLPSGINSISMSVSSDPGTGSFRMCNLVACKAPGPDAITHLTLLGKNTLGEPEWYGISEITSTEIILGGSSSQLKNQDPPRPYRGVTEAVTTYKRECLPGKTTAERTLNEGGTATAPITLSGGWNSTDMSTQVGETWLTGFHGLGSPIAAAATIQFVTIEKIAAAHFVRGCDELNHGWVVDMPAIICCGNAVGADTPSSLPAKSRLKVGQVWGCAGMFFSSLGHEVELEVGRIHGFCDTAALPALNNPAADTILDLPTWKIGKIDNNAGYAVEGGEVPYTIYNTVMENNAQGDVIVTAIGFYRKTLTLINCTLSSTTKLNTSGAEAFSLKETAIAGDPRANMTTLSGGSWYSTEVSPHTPGGVNWVMAPTSDLYYEEFPMRMPLCKVAVEANKLVEVKAWIRRSSSSITGGLDIDGMFPGTTPTVAYQAAAAGVWEEVTLSFTPTLQGVIQINAIAFGGTTHTVEFADVTVTQAA